MSNVEQIVTNIHKEMNVIADAFKNIQQLCSNLENANSEDYDWVSVKKASEIIDVSQPMIYERVTDGRLSSKRFGSKLFVKLSEVKAVNDKV